MPPVILPRPGLIRLLLGTGSQLYNFSDLDPGGVLIFNTIYKLSAGRGVEQEIIAWPEASV